MSLSLVFLLYLYLNYDAVCSGLLSVYSALWKGMVLISLPQNLYCLVNCPPDNQPTYKLILHRNQPRYPHLSIHLSIYLTPIFLSLHIYFYLSLLFIFLSIHIYPHIFFSIHLSLHIYLSTYLSYLYLSTYRPIYPYLSYRLSVFLSSRQPTNQPSL